MKREEQRLRARRGGLIVCEQTGMWAEALRRQPGAEGWPLVETRSAQECLLRLAERPWSVVVVELTRARCETALGLLATLDRTARDCCPLAVAARDLRACEWIAREAGARHFVASPRRAAPLMRIALGHLQTVPLPELDGQEEILATLPWDLTAG